MNMNNQMWSITWRNLGALLLQMQMGKHKWFMILLLMQMDLNKFIIL
jgi:hypothetical protein